MTKAASFRYAPLRPPLSSSSSGLLLAASLFPARLSILSSSVSPFHLRLRPPPLSPSPPRRGSSSSSSALFPARIEAKVLLPLLLSAVLSPPRPPPRPPPLPSSGCCSSFPFSLDRPSPTPRPAFARTNDRPGLSPDYFSGLRAREGPDPTMIGTVGKLRPGPGSRSGSIFQIGSGRRENRA